MNQFEREHMKRLDADKQWREMREQYVFTVHEAGEAICSHFAYLAEGTQAGIDLAQKSFERARELYTESQELTRKLGERAGQIDAEWRKRHRS